MPFLGVNVLSLHGAACWVTVTGVSPTVISADRSDATSLGSAVSFSVPLPFDQVMGRPAIQTEVFTTLGAAQLLSDATTFNDTVPPLYLAGLGVETV